MEFVGRLHPLLIHFPIALVIAAALAEGAAIVTADEGWRTVAVGNVRAGAVFALLATIAGWRLALAPEMEVSPLLECIGGSEPWPPGRRLRLRSRQETFAVDRRWVKFTGLLCSRRECWWPSPGISEDCWCGVRTFCAHEGGMCVTDRR
jgi:Predicted membrane protein (DUF2231)